MKNTSNQPQGQEERLFRSFEIQKEGATLYPPQRKGRLHLMEQEKGKR